MRQIYSLEALLHLDSNGWRCTDCGKAWLDDTPVALVPSQLPEELIRIAGRECRHPKLIRTQILRQPRQPTPQELYRRKKRRSMK